MNEGSEFVQMLPSLGVGGILGGLAIWMLNKAWREHAETIKGFHEAERGRTEMLVGVITRVESSITKNTVVTESLHKRLDKDAFERELKGIKHE